METKYLEFETCGQVLIRTDNITVVAGAANLYAARFTFTPEWDGEVKTAQFKLADGTTYDAAITDDICDVPWEAIQKPGTVIVGVFAGNLITTDAAKLEVYESSFDPEDAPVNEPSPGALPAAILKAHEYMTTAGEYADDAAQSAAAAKVSEDNAAESEDAASEKAETAAEEAKNAGDSASAAASSEAEAKKWAEIAANNILNGINTHNASPDAHADIREDIRTVEAIARSRATAYVFDTYDDMIEWLSDSTNTEKLVRGDNLYIRDTGVKDYWWDGTEPQELEAESPDLTDYYTKTQVDAKLPIVISRSEYNELYNSGTVEAGRIYYIYED